MTPINTDERPTVPGPEQSPWLHRLVVVTAAATLCLIGVGGMVTSRGVGMAVPDWPNTYGYNLFLFPFSKWIGGIFYEHTHRLAASLVGLLTAIVAIWMWARETRGRERWLGVSAFILVLLLMGVRQLPVYIGLACLAPVIWGVSFWQIGRHRPSRLTRLHSPEPSPLIPLPSAYVGELRRDESDGRGLRWWGVVAFSAVILQGVLGGLRVVLFKDELGIFHAALAQLFLVLLCVIALFTWEQRQAADRIRRTDLTDPTDLTGDNRTLAIALCGTTLLIFCQLLIGATMRHQHAGLAIPDFPLAYGKFWPAMDAASVTSYNRRRLEVLDANAITAFQIGLQMIHRLVAGLILAGTVWCAWMARRHRELGKSTLAWFCLIVGQALLGAATIWSNKAADIATAHVMVGAVSLAFGAVLSIICFRGLGLPGKVVSQREPSVLGQDPFGRRASALTSFK